MSYADSHGLSTLKDKKLNDDVVLIFDLDGTILSINSFPQWVLFMIKGDFGDLGLLSRIILSLRTAFILALRKGGMMDHRKAKQHFQKLWHKACAKDASQSGAENFQKQLMKKTRPNIEGCLELARHKENHAILATAAAGEYAKPLGEKLGFDNIITTPSYSDGFGKENVREEKRDRVMTFIENKGWNDKIRIFFTDHEEDLPLAKNAHITLWFGPDDKAKTAKTDAPEATIIPCQNATQEEVLAHLKGFLAHH